VQKDIAIILEEPEYHRSRLVGETQGIGGELPTFWLITRNSAMMAAWFVVML
jgi:hypothetical protein